MSDYCDHFKRDICVGPQISKLLKTFDQPQRFPGQTFVLPVLSLYFPSATATWTFLVLAVSVSSHLLMTSTYTPVGGGSLPASLFGLVCPCWLLLGLFLNTDQVNVKVTSLALPPSCTCGISVAPGESSVKHFTADQNMSAAIRFWKASHIVHFVLLLLWLSSCWTTSRLVLCLLLLYTVLYRQRSCAAASVKMTLYTDASKGLAYFLRWTKHSFKALNVSVQAPELEYC